MNNISEKTEYACSGCGACAAVCPKNAVSLTLDSAGFYTAAADASLCVDCGLCQKVCPRFTAQTGGVSLYDAPLFALQSSDADTVKHCSSGGIAHELAALALREGMTVVGAAYDLDTDRVKHIAVRDAAQLRLLDGSKYLQSDPAVFRDVLAAAKADPAARFAVFGTPCQITGLARAAELTGVREQFLLTEIFCHGVPSYRVWDEECRRIRQKLGPGPFAAVSFRDKEIDWHNYRLTVQSNGKSFCGQRETDLFWQVFFENILLGDACMNCAARRDRSCADLRIGDYWGTRFARRSDGISAVFTMTAQGRAAIRALREANQLAELDSGTAEEMLKAQNMAGYHQQALHDEAIEILRSGEDVMQAVKSYRRNQSRRQKLKRALLRISAAIPDQLRIKMRKLNSARKVR